MADLSDVELVALFRWYIGQTQYRVTQTDNGWLLFDTQGGRYSDRHDFSDEKAAWPSPEMAIMRARGVEVE